MGRGGGGYQKKPREGAPHPLLPHQAMPKMELSSDPWRRRPIGKPRKRRRAPVEGQETPSEGKPVGGRGSGGRPGAILGSPFSARGVRFPAQKLRTRTSGKLLPIPPTAFQ